MPTGRAIPDPGFAGDDGSADPQVAAALLAAARAPSDPAAHAQALAVLAGSRLLLPVVAVLDEPAPPGGDAGPGAPEAEKDSHLAAVLSTGRDGRRGLLAFTGTVPLARWDPRARPVPLAAGDAARAAVAEGAQALLVDLAGPAAFALEGRDLEALAAGYRPVAGADGLLWALGVSLQAPGSSEPGSSEAGRPERPAARPGRRRIRRARGR